MRCATSSAVYIGFEAPAGGKATPARRHGFVGRPAYAGARGDCIERCCNHGARSIRVYEIEIDKTAEVRRVGLQMKESETCHESFYDS
jgi:hypothetical protein